MLVVGHDLCSCTTEQKWRPYIDLEPVTLWLPSSHPLDTIFIIYSLYFTIPLGTYVQKSIDLAHWGILIGFLNASNLKNCMDIHMCARHLLLTKTVILS